MNKEKFKRLLKGREENRGGTLSRDILRNTTPLKEILSETTLSPLPFEEYLTELSRTTENIYERVEQQQSEDPGPAIVETSTTQDTVDAQYVSF